MVLNDVTYPFEYASTSTGNTYYYYWDVSIPASGLGNSIYSMYITAEDELGNTNTTIYWLNVSDTIPPEFNIEIFKDKEHMESTNIVGLGKHYVYVNASEPSNIDHLTFNTSFNSQTITISLAPAHSIDFGKNYITEWNGTFTVPLSYTFTIPTGGLATLYGDMTVEGTLTNSAGNAGRHRCIPPAGESRPGLRPEPPAGKVGPGGPHRNVQRPGHGAAGTGRTGRHGDRSSAG